MATEIFSISLQAAYIRPLRNGNVELPDEVRVRYSIDNKDNQTDKNTP